MKTVLKNQEKKLVLLVSIPFITFIILLTVCLWVASYNAMLHETDANAEKLVREMDIELSALKNSFNQSLTQQLQAGYADNFSEERVETIKKALLAVSSPFKVEDVHYLRVSSEFQIYDTDLPGEFNRNISRRRQLVKKLTALRPGDFLSTRLIAESGSEDIRLYGGVKLMDLSYFGVSIRLHGISEWLQGLTEDIFTNGKSEIAIYVPFSAEEKQLFEQSEKSSKPVYTAQSLTTARFYISKTTKKGTYNFIIHTQFKYPLYFISAILIIAILLLTFQFIVNRRVNRLSKEFSSGIETLDKNMKNFLPLGVFEQPEMIQTDITEINSIFNTFIKMRKSVVESYKELRSANHELEIAYLENQTLLNKVEAFMNVPDYLLYLNDTEKFLKRSFEKMIELVNPYDYAYVTVIDEGIYHFLDFIGLDVNMMNRLQLIADNYPRAEDKVALFNYQTGQYHKERADIVELEDETKDIQQSLTIPIASDNKYYGSMTILTKYSSERKLTEDDYRMAVFFSNYLKGYLMIKELSDSEETIQKETIFSLIRLLERHDPYTKGHSENVARLASKFAYFLGCSDQLAQQLYWAGIAHDMGKALIPHSILNKPTQLTTEEFEIIKQHPVYAYDIIKDNKNMENIAVYIRHHHEQYDGSGYPDGLKGKAIPFESRLLTLADSWDAMTAERVYKKGMTTEDAITEIKKNSGRQFDPELVEKWIKFIR